MQRLLLDDLLIHFRLEKINLIRFVFVYVRPTGHQSFNKFIYLSWLIIVRPYIRSKYIILYCRHK